MFIKRQKENLVVFPEKKKKENMCPHTLTDPKTKSQSHSANTKAYHLYIDISYLYIDYIDLHRYGYI